MFIINSFDAHMDEDVQDVIANGVTNAYDIPTQPWLNRINGLVRELKAEGIWAKSFLIYYWAGDGDLDFKMLNLIDDTTYEGSHFNVPTTSNTGITFNGTDEYVRTGFVPNDEPSFWSDSDGSARVYVIDAGTFAERWLGGYNTSAGNNIASIADSTTGFRLQSSSSVTKSHGGTGYKALARPDNSNLEGTDETTHDSDSSTGVTPSSLGGHEIGFGRASTNYYDSGFSYIALGGYLTEAEREAERTAILNWT